MKNNCSIIMKFTLAILCGMGVQQYATAQAEVTLNVSADTYVSGQGSTRSSTNYGSDVEGRVRDTTTSAPRITFYKFDFPSSLPATINTATLKFFTYIPIDGATSDIVEIHKYINTWTEDGLTFNNKQETGAFISEVPVNAIEPVTPNVYQQYTVDITSYFNQIVSASGSEISIILKAKAANIGGGDLNIRTGMKENTDQVVGATIVLNEATASLTDQDNAMALKVFPNPVSNQFTLTRAFTTNEVVDISIYDVLGSKITSIKESINPGVWTKDLNAKDLNMKSGLYFVKINSQFNGNSAYKIMVQ